MATKKWYFRKPIDEPMKTVTPSGEEVETMLGLKIDENGNEVFYEKAKTNVWEKIQAFKKETDIGNIIRTFTETGDIRILEKTNPQYVDVENMPSNIFEAQQKIKDLEMDFMTMPIEVRKAYEFNFNKYLADMGSENWAEIVGLKKKEEPVEPMNEPEEGDPSNE